MRAALIQICASDDPALNLTETRRLVSGAADNAKFILTPEVTNCVSTSRSRQVDVLQHEDQDFTLAALRDDAAKLGNTNGGMI